MINPLNPIHLLTLLSCITSLTHLVTATPTLTPSDPPNHPIPNHDLDPLQPRGAGGSTPRLPFGTTTLNTSQLPLILSLSDTESRTSDTHSIDTIRNKLALYTFAVDGGELVALDAVFDKDAVWGFRNGSGTSVWSGLDVIKEELSLESLVVNGMEGGGRQTLLGNVFVEVVDERDAWSVAYWRVVQWGPDGNGSAGGEVVVGFGMYQDSWFRAKPGTQAWRIIRRNWVNLGPSTGNLTISTA